jgi:hypothetical protein
MVRSMQPVIQKAGIASPADIGVETLAERLRRDAVDHERVIYAQRLVSAWTAVPAAHSERGLSDFAARLATVMLTPTYAARTHALAAMRRRLQARPSPDHE